MKFLRSLINPLQHCEKTVIYLLECLHINATSTSIQNDLLVHPDYPSLLSISDVLKGYGVDNIAFKMKRDSFEKLDTPFIAHIISKRTKHGLFGIVTSVRPDGIALFNPDTDTEELLSSEEFDKIYLGTVLAIETGEHTGEKNFYKKLKEQKRKEFIFSLITFLLPVLVAIAAAAAFFFYNWRDTLAPVIYTVLTLAGCVIGTLLLWHEVDEYNPTIKDICHPGKKVNCSAVLNSDAAKVFGISWSLLGSTYFIGMLLALLTGGIMNADNLLLLSWINVIALPYIVYSISYQYFVAKQWCVLCLAVQAVLFLQFITALEGGFHQLGSLQDVPYQNYLTVASSFGVIFITLLLLIPVLEKAKDRRHKTIALQRLKYNPEIFEALLSKQKTIEETTEGLGITIGKPAARYKLIKVCNPYCGPCARAHPVIEELLKDNEELQVQIIFTATEKEEDYRAQPVKHLLAIAAKGDEALTRQALDDWYNAPVRDYNVFAAKYPLNGELQQQSLKIRQMSNWCNETAIEHTPTFFVNKKQLPEIYSIADLKRFFM